MTTETFTRKHVVAMPDGRYWLGPIEDGSAPEFTACFSFAAAYPSAAAAIDAAARAGLGEFTTKSYREYRS